MRALALIAPTFIGLLAVAQLRLSESHPVPSAMTGPAASVGALPCLDCDGCDATTVTIPPTIPNLTINIIPAMEGADDGVCDTQAVCVGTSKCVFDDGFQIDDQTGLSLVYIASGTEVGIRPGMNYITVKQKKVTCDTGSGGPLDNVYSVCIHAYLNNVWTEVWARHYLCSWCDE